MKFTEYLRDFKDLLIATVINIRFQHMSLACLTVLLLTVVLTVCGDSAFAPDANPGKSISEQTPAAATGENNTSPAPNESQSSVALNSVETSTYTVKSGDTLWDIAMACKTTVEQIMALNHLDSENLSIGQQLIIAGSIPPPSQNRTVQVASRSGSSNKASATTSITKKAAQYLNTPYVWGGSKPGGFDCSGFVQYVFAQCGYKLPRTAADQAAAGTRISRKNLVPGDLVYFRCGGGSIDHIGIYVGNNKFIHASSPRSGGVIYTSLSESFYANSYAGATRIAR